MKTFSMALPAAIRLKTLPILAFYRATVLRKRCMTEPRKSGCARALKDAKVFFGSSSMVDCVVRDLTNSGAHVEIPSTVELPEAFGLTFDGGYSLRPCRIVWRTSNETCVEFL
jgi:hypothetical protein